MRILKFKKFVSVILGTTIFLICANFFSGKKNVFEFKHNFTKISDLENKILEVNERNKKLIFLHDEFKKENKDILNYYVRKNLNYRKYKFFSIFSGFVCDIYTVEKIESSREQTNRYGRLELIEKKRTWLILELEDEDGYLGKLTFPLETKHSQIQIGSKIRCLVSSNNRNFQKNLFLTDAWLPDLNLWIGDYPFLLRPAFEEICYIYKNKLN